MIAAGAAGLFVTTRSGGVFAQGMEARQGRDTDRRAGARCAARQPGPAQRGAPRSTHPEVVPERGAASETQVTELLVWRVDRATYACALTLVTHDDRPTPATEREWLAAHEQIVHSTIAIHRCPDG